MVLMAVEGAIIRQIFKTLMCWVMAHLCPESILINSLMDALQPLRNSIASSSYNHATPLQVIWLDKSLHDCSAESSVNDLFNQNEEDTGSPYYRPRVGVKNG